VTRDQLDLLLASLIPDADRHGWFIPVVSVDLDQFGEVNDWLGFDAGDQVLREAAHRLAAKSAHGGCAALGGDEFVCVLEPCESEGRALKQAREMLRVLDAPFEVEGNQLRVSASAGISLYPVHSRQFEPLLRSASAELRLVKRRARNRVEIISQARPEGHRERALLGNALRNGLDESGFRLRFQPLVELTGSLMAFEALAEWRHPELGVISPERFIRLAEECGRITDLGLLLLKQAARQAARWRERYGFEGRVAVNISPLQLDHPEFVDRVRGVLDDADLAGVRLGLEITESELIADVDRVKEACDTLREIGVAVCLDDFGVGWASLRLVQDLPLDGLKIDRSFIDDLGKSPSAQRLIEAVISIAHERGIRVVAEGVETVEQLRRLARTSCDGVQGFLLSPPLDADAAEQLLAGQRHWGNLRACSAGFSLP